MIRAITTTVASTKGAKVLAVSLANTAITTHTLPTQFTPRDATRPTPTSHLSTAIDKALVPDSSLHVARNVRAAQALHDRLQTGSTDNFYILDLEFVRQQCLLWKEACPRVKPMYAIKSNAEESILHVVNDMGFGFDCASRSEMERTIAAGVDPSDIIFAHPFKEEAHLREAARMGVNMTVYQSREELDKIAAVHPDCRVLLRVATNDDASICKLSQKFGASAEDAPGLLEYAKQIGVNVCGIAYHVGSGCYDIDTYIAEMGRARGLYDLAADIGLKFDLLDIGGGYPGTRFLPPTGPSSRGGTNADFVEIARAKMKALDELFPESAGVEVLAEPGRFFSEGCASLAVNVIARGAATDGSMVNYYLNDGIFSAFSCIPWDHAIVYPAVIPCEVANLPFEPFMEHLRSVPMHWSAKDSEHSPHAPDYISSTLWGPTCDGQDVVLTDVPMPNMNVGDWLLFDCMGSYCREMSSTFNGYHVADNILVRST